MSNTSSRPGYDDFDDSAGGLIAFGTVSFAGVILSVTANFQILEGISAVANDKLYVVGLNYAYEFDVTTWGWIHIVVGAIALATGIGLLVGQSWARVLGIFMAVVAIITNFAYLPYYPFWSIVIIGFGVFVIWALCRQMSADSGRH
jgi:hypothetical protein